MATGISTLGRALQQIELIQMQQGRLNDLNTQLATGKKTQSLSGLGTDMLTSNRARADIRTIQTYQTNISQANTRIEQMLNSVDEFKEQAKNFADVLAGFMAEGNHQKGEVVYYDDPLTPEIENTPIGMTSAEPGNGLQTVTDMADSLFEFMGNLLNSRQGERYIFAGAETQNPPFNDNGVLGASVSTLLTSWKSETITTDQLISDFQDRTATAGNPDALTDTVVGYSSAVASGSAKDVFVRVDDGQELEYTALANETGFRDVMVALSVFRNENLPPIVDAYTSSTFPAPPDANGAPGETNDEMQENFFAMVGSLSTMVTNAIDSIDSTRNRLETTRVQMEETRQKHANDKALFDNIIGDVEDADINEVAVRINALQLNLEASLTITGRVQQLSLVNFI